MKSGKLLLLSLFIAVIFCASYATLDPQNSETPITATFSIVAYDAETEEWGIGVASKVLAVGYIVPWARAGVGAVATQALVNVSSKKAILRKTPSRNSYRRMRGAKKGNSALLTAAALPPRSPALKPSSGRDT
jgi:hypothetical protein